MNVEGPQTASFYRALTGLLLAFSALGSGFVSASENPDLDKKNVNQRGNLQKECKGTFAGPLTLASAGRLQGRGFKWAYLEDFNDQKANARGLSGAGTPSSSFGQEKVDSVSGDAWWGSGSLEFSFSSKVLGALPTRAGLVWTDGAGSVTFEAWGACGYLGKTGPFSGFPDGDSLGGKSEDRYFEVIAKVGISRIRISNTVGGIEVDNLRYALGNSDDSCAGQLEAIDALEKEAIAIFLKAQQEWKTIGKRFPANSNRKEKARIAHADDAESEAVKLVAEILKNGALEDKFLKDFNWERHKNDVLFAFAYLKSCRGDFQALRRLLKKQSDQTEKKSERIVILSKKVDALFNRDEKEFIGSNDDRLGLRELIEKAVSRGPIPGFFGAINDFRKAARNAADVGTRRVLLPRLLERAETLAYLNALAQRYETRLKMHKILLEKIDQANDRRDCKKCRGKSKKP